MSLWKGGRRIDEPNSVPQWIEIFAKIGAGHHGSIGQGIFPFQSLNKNGRIGKSRTNVITYSPGQAAAMIEMKMRDNRGIDLVAENAGRFEGGSKTFIGQTEDRLGFFVEFVAAAGLDDDESRSGRIERFVEIDIVGMSLEKQAIVPELDAALLIGRISLAPQHARDDAEH